MSKTLRLLCAFLFSFSLAPIASPQVATFVSGSAASYTPIVAPGSIAAGFGSNVVTTSAVAMSLPLPMTLGGAQVTITDSTGAKIVTPLFMAFTGQINYLVPANTALGKATVTVVSGTGTFQGALLVSNIAPAIFTADMSGKGVPAAQALRVTTAGTTSYESAFKTGSTASSFVTSPISLASATDQVYLILYGTGVRRHSKNPVQATIGGVNVPVAYAGPQAQYPGLDQINLGPLPQGLVGKGEVDLVIRVDGVPANTVRVAFQ